MFNESFKDTYLSLNGEECRLSASTVIETENEVIRGILSPILLGEGGIKSIGFLPFGDSEREKTEEVFGNVFEDKEDAYLVVVSKNRITVYANSLRGHLYGACTLYSHYRDGIREGYIYNVPLVEFRAAKMYLPAEDKLEEFYYLVDMLMHYGYNALVLEVGGAMEYEKHPEINDFWVETCRELSEHTGKATMLQCSTPWGKNSIHIENGGGKFLSKKLVSQICDYARARGIEPIPEVPSLSHSDYLIAGRKELAERPEDPFPDTCCPSNPKYYEILFEVLDEVIEVFSPKVVHIAHDEYYVYGVCKRCRGKKGAELFAEDIKKIHGYLSLRGIRTMMWAEKLLNSYSKDWRPAGGARYTIRYTPSGQFFTYKGERREVLLREVIHPYDEPSLGEGDVYSTIEQTYPAIAMIPKDVIAMNWYYAYYELSDIDYHYHGLPMVYGNFSGNSIVNWRGRVAAGAKGFAVSSWGASDFKQMQRGVRIADIVLASRMAWSREYNEKEKSREAAYTAASAFDYRYRNVLKGSHIDIVHTSDINIKHGYFGCGDFLIDDMFRLGYYHVYYKDGTDERVEILWGENIGNTCLDSEKIAKGGFEEDGIVKAVGMSRQTIFTCDFVDEGEKGRSYRFVIPTEKSVLRVEPELFDEYKEKVYIKSITIKNEN